MDYRKAMAMYVLAFVLLATLMPATFAQEFDLEMSEVGRSESLYRAKLTISPVPADATESGSSDDREDDSESVHVVSLEFFVKLGQSNSWLLEDDPDRQLTDEEVFARDLFLAKRGATSLTDLRDYMEGDLYREKEDLYSRNEEARDRELSAFRNFTDVRLLGVVRYGEFHFFLNVIKRPGETSSEIRAGFAARKNEGRYMQTGDPASHIATTFFRPGFLQDEIYMELERFVQ